MDPTTVNEAAELFEAAFDEHGEFLEVDEPVNEEVAERFEEELEEEEAPEAPEEPEEGEEEDPEDNPEEEENDPEADPEEATDPVPDDTLFDITIDGEEYEVNLAELRAGYLRQEEFVKRSTALQSEHDAKLAELAQREADLVREIESTAVIATADLKKYENVDWKALKASDPAAFAEQYSDFMEKREAIQRQLQRRSQVQQLHQKAEAIKHQAQVEAQYKVALELIPELESEGYKEKIFGYAESIGITRDEVAAISDARHLLLLDQARKYAESQIKRKGVVEKLVPKAKDLPPVVKPGAKKPAADAGVKRQKGLEARLAQTGSIRDAAAAFEAFV